MNRGHVTDDGKLMQGRHQQAKCREGQMESGQGDRRIRRGGSRNRGGAAHLAQCMPKGALRNSLQPIEPLSADQLMMIHDASLRLLEEIGIEFMGAAARRSFRQAGASVNDATGLVRIPRELVSKGLSTAPATFRLIPRTPVRAINLGGNHLASGLVA